MAVRMRIAAMLMGQDVNHRLYMCFEIANVFTYGGVLIDPPLSLRRYSEAGVAGW
jgi:hypothetical protein